MSGMLRRMTRAALLDADTFEEVEADRSALGQATAVVVLACVATGAARAWHGVQAGFETERLVFQVVLSVIEPLALWIGGSAFAFMLGASFFRGPQTQTDFREVLRTTGFAFSPALLWSLVVVAADGLRPRALAAGARVDLRRGRRGRPPGARLRHAARDRNRRRRCAAAVAGAVGRIGRAASVLARYSIARIAPSSSRIRRKRARSPPSSTRLPLSSARPTPISRSFWRAPAMV